MVKTPKTSAETALVLRELFINSDYITDNGGVATLGSFAAADKGLQFNDDTVITYSQGNINRVIKSGVFSIRIGGYVTNTGTDGGGMVAWHVNSDNRFYIDTPRNGNSNWRIIANVAGGGLVYGLGSIVANGYNEWVVCFNHSTWTAYFNGSPLVLGGSTVDFANLVGDNTFHIGGTDDTAASGNLNARVVEVYDRVLTAGEAIDLYQQDTFIETDAGQMKTYLPLTSTFNDGSNNVTENLGTGDNAIWGDGAGADEPTIVSPNGATFDGADSLIKLSDSDLLGISNRTVGALVKLNSYGEGSFGNIFGNGKMVLDPWYLTSDGYGTKIQTPAGVLNIGSYYTIIATRASNGDGEIFINGESVVSGSTGTPSTGGATYLGNNAGKTRTFDGDIHFPFNKGIILNQTQIRWMHDKMMRGLNN